MNRRWFVNSKLDGVELFIKRALAVEDKYTQIVNGEYEFPDDSNDQSSIANNDIDDFDALDAEDIMFLEYDHANDVLRFYEEIVFRAALNEINSIVEYELRNIASIAKAEESKEPLSKSWVNARDIGVVIKIIETAHKIKLTNLPGYVNVEKVRKIINAYKHDDGYSKEYEPFAGNWADMQIKYELKFENIIDYVHSAKEFLLALPNVGAKVGEDVTRRLRINPGNLEK